MAEHLEHDVTMQPVRIVEEDKTRVFALDLAVRTIGVRFGNDGSHGTGFEPMANMVLEVADLYLAWLKPGDKKPGDRPQDQ